GNCHSIAQRCEGVWRARFFQERGSDCEGKGRRRKSSKGRQQEQEQETVRKAPLLSQEGRRPKGGGVVPGNGGPSTAVFVSRYNKSVNAILTQPSLRSPRNYPWRDFRLHLCFLSDRDEAAGQNTHPES